MASPRTFLPGVQTGETTLNTIGQRIDRLYDNALPWATVTSAGSEGDTVTADILSNETGNPQDTVFLERGWLAGMGLRIAWPAANTGAVTLAVNGGSALNVLTADGSALAAGQLAAGLVVEMVYYDGAFVVVSSILDADSGEQARYFYKFTVSGTWDKPAGLGDDTAWNVLVWGAGGGGDNSTDEGGGGGGACAFGVFRHGDLPSSVVVTIGASGVLNSGGNSTFGSLLTGYGGGRGNDNAGGGGGGLLGKGEDADGTEANFLGGEMGGGNGTETSGATAANPWGGGGGGGDSFNSLGGNAYWGGAGGGKDGGGTSVLGGDGGAAGVAGAAPGGGGGPGATGGRGECWIFN